MIRLSFAIAAAFAVLTPALAQEPVQVATYRDWIVYTAEVDGDTICYAVTQADEMAPTTVNHGNVFFMVSTWKSGAANNQPSFMAGYGLRESPQPMVRVGSDRWDMFTAGQESFVEENNQEERLIAAMRRGSEMRVSAMSTRGTATEYSFSLFGISNALDRVDRACR